jgi:hypothetical protein
MRDNARVGYARYGAQQFFGTHKISARRGNRCRRSRSRRQLSPRSFFHPNVQDDLISFVRIIALQQTIDYGRVCWGEPASGFGYVHDLVDFRSMMSQKHMEVKL